MERLRPVAAEMLKCADADVRFEDGVARGPEGSVPLAKIAESAYKRRIALFAHGFYRTPEIFFDVETARGKPFHYFAYGAAVSEVEIDGFTGMHRLLRADLLEDVGDSVSPLIDLGQIQRRLCAGRGLAHHRRAAVGRAETSRHGRRIDSTSFLRGANCRRCLMCRSSIVLASRTLASSSAVRRRRRVVAADAGDFGARGYPHYAIAAFGEAKVLSRSTARPVHRSAFSARSNRCETGSPFVSQPLTRTADPPRLVR